MTLSRIVIAIIIHIIVPFIGLVLFIKLKSKMTWENIAKAPKVELFIIFATYGGLLLVVLTALFWGWSGMASLGIFYLTLAAPIAMAVIAIKNYELRRNSKYHNWTFKAAIFYVIISPITILILFLNYR